MRAQPPTPLRGRDAERLLAAGIAAVHVKEAAKGFADAAREAGGGAPWVAETLRRYGLEPTIVGDGEPRPIERHPKAVTCAVVGPESKPLTSAAAWPWSPSVDAPSVRVIADGPITEPLRPGTWVLVTRAWAHPDHGGLSVHLKKLAVLGAEGVVLAYGDPPNGEAVPLIDIPCPGIQPLPVVVLGSDDAATLRLTMQHESGRIRVVIPPPAPPAPVTSVFCTIPGRRRDRTVVVATSLDAVLNRGLGSTAASVAVALVMARGLHLSVKGGEIAPWPFDVTFAFLPEPQAGKRWVESDPALRRRVIDVLWIDRCAGGPATGIGYHAVKGSHAEDPSVRLAGVAAQALGDYRGQRGFWGSVTACDGWMWPAGWPLTESAVALTAILPATGDPASPAGVTTSALLVGTSMDTVGRMVLSRPEALVLSARAGLVLLGRLGEELPP